ncbi:hypothetical protein AB0M41_18500 [Streptomyces sp. NPDC051896]|uniref:hypothetical protein n=1 Tax=Streptomyces sp. NPDC051896 TaxID=3155416 RepID=UPI0034475814
MDEIDASSRFQAGLIVGRRGLLADDGPPGPADDDPEAASEGGSDRTSDDKE